VDQHVYQIETHSVGILTIVSFIIFCSCSIVLERTDLLFENRFLYILQFLLQLILSFYIAIKLSRAKSEVRLTEFGLVHIWKKRYLFSKEKSLKISWEIIKYSKLESDRAFDTFKVMLTENREYKIRQQNMTSTKDDFKKLTSEFHEVMDKYKTNQHSK